MLSLWLVKADILRKRAALLYVWGAKGGCD